MNINDIASKAQQASGMCGALAHPTRLNVLWILCEGENSVGELARRLALRQSAVSQQLARLRRARLVTTRREGRMIFYSLAGWHVRTMIETVHDIVRDQRA